MRAEPYTGERPSRSRSRLPLLTRILPLGLSRRIPIGLVIGGVAVAAGLGVWGFSVSSEPTSVWDAIYRTMQLFVLEWDAPESVPLQLHVARFLAPLVTVLTALQGLLILFREQLEEAVSRRSRDHVVVCTLGRKGFALVQSLRRAGERVVVIERDAENDHVGPARDEGALVVLGDASSPGTLRRAAVGRARALVAISGDDGLNAEIIARTREAEHGLRPAPLQCVAHVTDPNLCALLRLEELSRAPDPMFRLEFFNMFERGAAELLDEVPPWQGDEPGEGEPHLVVVGIGRFGESLVVEAARRWRRHRAARTSRLHVTLVDRDAQACADALVHRHAHLAGSCALVPVALEVGSHAFQSGDFVRAAEGRPTASAVYVCIDDASLALAASLRLHRNLEGLDVPIVVRTASERGIAALLSGARGPGERFEAVRAFGLVERTCNERVVLEGTLESLGRAVHERYVQLQRLEGRTVAENPSMAPWHVLPETLRESSRQQAASIGVHLRTIDCALAPMADWDAEAFDLSGEEIEKLARLEHERWIEERRRMGWTYGEKKDVAGMRSPYLVPWDGLPKVIQDYDRAFVRELPHLAARAGLQIVRRSDANRPPETPPDPG